MNFILIRSKRLGGISLLALLAAAALPSVAAEGVVVDKVSGNPIPHAIIVATWNGVVGTLVQSASQCYHVESTIADEKGRFHVSSFSGNWNPLMIDRRRYITALAPGYRESPGTDPGGPRVLMERRTGSKSEQFKQLPEFGVMGCNGEKRQLLPYLKLLHDEMTLLATTKEEKLATSGVLFQIEEIELGRGEAIRRLGPREGEIKQSER